MSGIVEGGAERYDSVLCGLRAAGGNGLMMSREDRSCSPEDPAYVFIHDGARPFINDDILNRAFETVKKYGTAIVAVPSKDTVKIVDSEGVATDTPDRSTVWLMQTPQVFAYGPILEAYERMDEYKKSEAIGSHDKGKQDIMMTDDAMVMEQFGSLPIHVSEGSYKNIKITTPEDMIIAGAFIS